MMKFLLENARYVILLAVISTLIGSCVVFLWATFTMVMQIYQVALHAMKLDMQFHMVEIVEILDTYLLAVVLYIFSAALYELFIGKLDLPAWLVIRSLDDLKKKLSSVMALILAVTFVEHVVEWKNPQETLMFAVAIAVMIFALVYYMRNKQDSHELSE